MLRFRSRCFNRRRQDGAGEPSLHSTLMKLSADTLTLSQNPFEETLPQQTCTHSTTATTNPSSPRTTASAAHGRLFQLLEFMIIAFEFSNDSAKTLAGFPEGYLFDCLCHVFKNKTLTISFLLVFIRLYLRKWTNVVCDEKRCQNDRPACCHTA